MKRFQLPRFVRSGAGMIPPLSKDISNAGRADVVAHICQSPLDPPVSPGQVFCSKFDAQLPDHRHALLLLRIDPTLGRVFERHQFAVLGIDRIRLRDAGVLHQLFPPKELPFPG